MSGVVPFPTTHNGGPSLEEAPAYTDRNRRRDPWFKFYPADWLRDTRNLTLEQRGAYIDSIAIQMERGESIPDDVSWLAHQLHISTRKARSLVQQLVDAKMLLRQNGQLTNKRCEKEIAEREAQRANIAHSASVRERAKREPELNRPPLSAEPELNRAPVNSENSEKHNENNEAVARPEHGRGHTRAGASARQNTEVESDIEDTLSNESVSKGEKELPAPRLPEGSADEDKLHRQWQAVTARAEQKGARPKSSPGAAALRAMGELDGSRGVLFKDGKLEIINGTAASLLLDFPGVDLAAVCNRAGPEVAKISYPTFERAMPIIRRAAQFALEDAKKSGRSKPGSRLGGRPVDQVAKSLPKEKQQAFIARLNKGVPNAR